MKPAPTTQRYAKFGVFEADLHACELRKHGLRIKLAGQPFQVLTLLLESGGTVVTRDDLRRHLWPNEPWGEHDQRLNNILNKIREALGDAADTPRFVETLPRVGYRFLVEVELFDKQAPAAREAPPAAPVVSPPRPARRPFSAAWLGLGAALAVVVSAVLLVFRPVSPAAPPVSKAAPLTTSIGSELYPALSPDGSHVAFAWDGESGRDFHIYTARVSGGAPRQVTFGAGNDSAPVWSPEGRQLAFLRDSAAGGPEVWLMSADGQQARRLRQIRSSLAGQVLAWTRDPAWLLVAQALPQKRSHALFLLSAKTGEEFPLSSGAVEGLAGDLNPAISPDGTLVAFTRSTSSAWSDIFVARLRLESRRLDPPVRLTDAHSIVEHLAWLPDSSALVFSSATTMAGARHLFRVGATPAGAPRAATELGIEGDHPTIAGQPAKLAYVRKNIEQSSIWRLDLTQGLAQPKPHRMITSTRRDYSADLSPDGARMVFSSVRSGTTEIWMAKTDGTNLERLTNIGGMTPRWSPDGKQVAFESNQRGQSDIYVLEPGTSVLRRLTNQVATNKRPSWSRDGRFVYFSSDRTGRPQIWKVPGQGGDAVQITRNGGMYAVETFDGRAIYYTSDGAPADVWTTSSNGGDESRVIQQMVGFSSIAMARDGVYFLSRLSASGAQLDFYRLADHRIIGLAAIDRPVHRFLSSTADGRSVLYSQIDQRDSDLMLIEGFR